MSEEILEKTFVDYFYESVQIFKEYYKLFLPIIICSCLLNFMTLINTNNQNDADRIILALGGGLLSTVFFVFAINIFTSRLNGFDFSISKSMWDIPTYLISELGFGLLFLAGTALLLIPGIFVYFFYVTMPLISIGFDHLDSHQEGNFSLAKKISLLDKMTYFKILLVGLVVGLAGVVSEKVYLLSRQNYFVAFGFSFIEAVLLIINLGLLLSYISHGFKTLYSREIL